VRALRVLFAGPAIAAAFAPAAATQPAPAVDVIQLPAAVHSIPAIPGVPGVLPDRLLVSKVPGPVIDSESLWVQLGPTGAPARVSDTQRLVVTGIGDYVVRERGPARQATPIGLTVPPVLELGTVVWQGFSPGRRPLAATLLLDPAIEAERLPMSVSLSYTDARGKPGRLGPGGRVPGPGSVSITLTNQTTAGVLEPIATGAPASVAAAMQLLLTAADRPVPGAPPTAGAGLPTSIPGQVSAEQVDQVTAPLLVAGWLRLASGKATVAGLGITGVPGGARVSGTLDGSVTFTLHAATAGTLMIDLTAQPWLDPRLLSPPAPYPSWAAWAADGPASSAVNAATAQLISGAAAAARAAEYTPYLEADVSGHAVSTFRYTVAPAQRVHLAVPTRLQAAGVAAACVALLAIGGNAWALRRQF
jgi:hypothetical protein